MVPSDYRAIAAWGRRLGSLWDYIKQQQVRALCEEAPIDALYRQDGSAGWFCMTDLKESNPPVYVAMRTVLEEETRERWRKPSDGR